MNARRIISSAPQAVTSSGIAPAHPKVALSESHAATFSVERAAAVSPFASLKQERTVEAKVSTQLLTLAKGGMAMGGATQSYQVPDELMALAGRKAATFASAKPPAGQEAINPGRAGLGAASRAPSLAPQSAFPSIAVAAPQ